MFLLQAVTAIRRNAIRTIDKGAGVPDHAARSHEHGHEHEHGHGHGHGHGHALRYRSDIDGLRALAVVAVVLYHLGSSLAPGGFVGVDVFFVISGFLITTVIRTEIDAGTFSILRFYERRVRRILPALFATCAATLAFALVVFMPDELRDLGASLVGIASFASNVLFWQQTDYFSGAVELKPLIHTWSLAVEEQYYIVFPMILLAVARWSPGRYLVPTLVLGLASFGWCLAAMWIDPSGGYYLLPSRGWELLVGSLLALAPTWPNQRRHAELLAMAGLAMIVGAVLLLDHDSPFPGYNALWPTLGTAAIIAAGTRAPTLVGRLLGLKPFVAAGLISYSLYLVHWPVIVFAGYLLLRTPSPVEQFGMVVLMVLLAVLSWRYVERPFRSRHRFTQRQVLTGAVAGLAIMAVVGVVTFAARGFPQRFPGLKITERPTEAAWGGQTCFLKGDWHGWRGKQCLIPGRGRSVTLLWGDSHANHYRRAIGRLSPPLADDFLFYGSAGCQPILDLDVPARPYCRGNNDHVFDIIRDYHVRTVVLSGYWWRLRNYRVGPADVARTVARLRTLGVAVKIIGDNPDFPVTNLEFLSYRLSRRDDPDAPFRLPVRNDWQVNPALRAIVGPADFFDPMAVLCRDRQCLISQDGTLLNTDNAHLSAYGSDMLLAHMRRFFDGPPPATPARPSARAPASGAGDGADRPADAPR